MLAEKNRPLLMDEKLELRLRHCKELPSPPGVAMQILDICKDPVADFSMVAEIISLDPALSAKILRIANSSMYARQRTIDNLRQAIMVLGLNGTLVLSLSFSLVNNLNRNSVTNGLDYNHFWRRSLETACACRQLGIKLGYTQTEDLFLAGLFADIGMLALNKVMPDLYTTTSNLQHNHQAIIDVEKTALNIDHAQIGAWLLRHWKLPSRWIIATAASHNPDIAEIDSEHLRIAQCTAVAGDLAELWCSENMDSALARATYRAEKWFNIDSATLGEVIEITATETYEIANLFNIDMGDKILMTSLLEEAKELLITHTAYQQSNLDNQLQTIQTLESQNKKLEYESTHDTLTKLYNRAYFDSVFNKEFEATLKRGWPLAILFIDLDLFKSLNDSYGHQAGDKALTHIAKVLLEVVRDTDIVARYGGEEFLIMLPGMGIIGARKVSERLLHLLRNRPLILNNKNEVIVTASVGIAVQNETELFKSPEMLIGAADSALYAAKSNGRNQSMVYGDEDKVMEYESL